MQSAAHGRAVPRCQLFKWDLVKWVTHTKNPSARTAVTEGIVCYLLAAIICSAGPAVLSLDLHAVWPGFEMCDIALVSISLLPSGTMGLQELCRYSRPPSNGSWNILVQECAAIAVAV